MNANKIDGVKPFNSFYYRSCYYHQLISALSCFGVDENNVIRNMFLFLSEDFGYEEKDIIAENELLKHLGCKALRCKLTKRSFCKSIDKGNPLIVGVDCYYLESRNDTYMVRHAPHYILMLGYDLSKDEAYVVDHDYMNSIRFDEVTISLNNLLLAAKCFNEWDGHKRRACQMIQNKTPCLNSQRLNLWKYLPKNCLEENRNISEKNLKALKELFIGDGSALKLKLQAISNYINKVYQFYKILSNIHVLTVESENIDLNRLISAYGVVQSAIWRMNAKKIYTVEKEQQAKLLNKIDEILGLEARIYDDMMRGIK